jgi:hypothetical protein
MKYDITQIDPNEWYRLSKISEMGWITNTNGDKEWKYVWRLVRDGKLKARNFSMPNKPLWRVRGETIIAYIQEKYL